jgi:NAD(P)-dependent dehydrogenase (short-subunit alcohol dehydrogenase family)
MQKPSIILVAGGASGIGEALCRLFALAKPPAQVIVADVNILRAQELASEIGGDAILVDLSDPESVEKMVSQCVERYAGIDLFINSAGVLARGSAETFTAEGWDRTLNLNLRGAVLATVAVYRQMMKQRSGHIVNIASLSGLNAPPFCLPYVTSKYGLVGFSHALRSEAKQYGIKVSVVCPGNVATPMIAPFMDSLSKLTPSISPETAARAIIRGVQSNSATIVFPAYARVMWLIERWTPWLSAWLRDYISAKSLQGNRQSQP